MTRRFSKGRFRSVAQRVSLRNKYNKEAYSQNDGLGSVAIKDLNFVERINYGVIDNENYSVIPNEEYLVPLKESKDPTRVPRVFDFVADAFSNMRLNFTVACQKGLIQREGAAFRELKVIEAYKNPFEKYEDYLEIIFNRFELYLKQQVGIVNITSYNDYVNHFINYIYYGSLGKPITLTRFQKSYLSSILDTGLAIKYFDIPVKNDQQKVDEIIDQSSFAYFENLCYNMGFSILHNRPNILLFDISSPSAKPYLSRYGLFNLDIIFNDRFNKTYLNDINILFNNINIYYNNFVLENPKTKKVFVKCRKTVSEIVRRTPVSLSRIPYSELEILSIYAKIKNSEEGFPFSQNKISQIIKRAIFLHKKLDNEQAISYISSEFKDQVWNKDYGYDDHLKRLRGQTTATSGERTEGEGTVPTSGGTPSGY